MELSIAIAPTVQSLSAPDAPPPVATGLTAIRSEGWDATYLTPPASFDPEGAPVTLAVTRAGFDGTGASVTHGDQLVVTRRVRLPYPQSGCCRPTGWLCRR